MGRIPARSKRPLKAAAAKPPDFVRDARGWIDKYGLMFHPASTEIEIELLCFRRGHPREDGGLGKYGHLKKALALIWPDLVRHEWMEWRLRKLCEYSTNAWAGSAVSGKSHDSILYAMVWWLALPEDSSVILTSTTGTLIKKRLWPVLTELFDSAVQIPNSPTMAMGFPGNLVDSKTLLQARRGDEKHGIFMIPIKAGPVSAAVANIQGIHSRRMLVIIDEATDTPEAIFQA